MCRVLNFKTLSKKMSGVNCVHEKSVTKVPTKAQVRVYFGRPTQRLVIFSKLERYREKSYFGPLNRFSFPLEGSAP